MLIINPHLAIWSSLSIRCFMHVFYLFLVLPVSFRSLSLLLRYFSLLSGSFLTILVVFGVYRPMFTVTTLLLRVHQNVLLQRVI